MQNIEKMMGEWGKTWENPNEDFFGGQMQMTPPQANIIQFQLQNQFKSTDHPIEDRLVQAKLLIEAQKIQEAVLCLEAEVQENGQNAEAWRILGQLYQEND